MKTENIITSFLKVNINLKRYVIKYIFIHPKVVLTTATHNFVG